MITVKTEGETWFLEHDEFINFCQFENHTVSEVSEVNIGYTKRFEPPISNFAFEDLHENFQRYLYFLDADFQTHIDIEIDDEDEEFYQGLQAMEDLELEEGKVNWKRDGF